MKPLTVQLPLNSTTLLVLPPLDRLSTAEVVQVTLECRKQNMNTGEVIDFSSAQDIVSTLISTIITAHRSTPLQTPAIFDDPHCNFYLVAKSMAWPYGKEWTFEWGEPWEILKPSDLKWVFLYVPKPASQVDYASEILP